MISRFNIRLYGIWVRQGQILLSFEESGDLNFWKFPGGGLEFGEGVTECLYREFKEELGVDIQTHDLYHVNEDFIPSAFSSEDQLITIYYHVHSDQEPTQMHFEEVRWNKPYKVAFNWLDLESLNPDMFRFPADKIVAAMLMDSFPGFIA